MKAVVAGLLFGVTLGVVIGLFVSGEWAVGGSLFAGYVVGCATFYAAGQTQLDELRRKEAERIDRRKRYGG